MSQHGACCISSSRSRVCGAGVFRGGNFSRVDPGHYPHPQSPPLSHGAVGGDGFSAARDAKEPPAAALRALAAVGGAVLRIGVVGARIGAPAGVQPAEPRGDRAAIGAARADH